MRRTRLLAREAGESAWHGDCTPPETMDDSTQGPRVSDVIRAEARSALDPRLLHLMIFPTEACNFRCTYCFEDHVPGRMQPNLVAATKKFLDHRVQKLDRLQLSFFGGEPLLFPDIVIELCEHAQQRCREHGVALAVSGVTTNGYFLTPALLERLGAVGLRHFHVSLDGLGAIHDRTRPHVSGRGTFERVWRNLSELRQSSADFDLVLRVHCGHADVADTEALCRAIDRTFPHDSRFRVLVQRIADLGGQNSGKFEPISVEEGLRLARHLKTLMPNIAVADPDTAEEGICYAARPNSLLIRTDGRLSKCAVNLNDPRNVVGRLNDDGRLELNQPLLQRWFKGFADFDPELLTCPMSGLGEYPSDAEPAKGRRLPVLAGNPSPVRTVTVPC